MSEVLIMTDDITCEEFFAPVLSDTLTVDMLTEHLCRQAQIMSMCMHSNNIPNSMSFRMSEKDGSGFVTQFLWNDGLEDFEIRSELADQNTKLETRAEQLKDDLAKLDEEHEALGMKCIEQYNALAKCKGEWQGIVMDRDDQIKELERQLAREITGNEARVHRVEELEAIVAGYESETR